MVPHGSEVPFWLSVRHVSVLASFSHYGTGCGTSRALRQSFGRSPDGLSAGHSASSSRLCGDGARAAPLLPADLRSLATGRNNVGDHGALRSIRLRSSVPTPNSVEINGEIRNTSEQRNRFELVSGTRGRSGQQIDIWSAVWGPIGDDGYFKPAFNKRTATSILPSCGTGKSTTT